MFLGVSVPFPTPRPVALRRRWVLLGAVRRAGALLCLLAHAFGGVFCTARWTEVLEQWWPFVLLG